MYDHKPLIDNNIDKQVLRITKPKPKPKIKNTLKLFSKPKDIKKIKSKKYKY